MRSFSVSICLSVIFSLGFAVQHQTSRSDVFDALADIMEDGLPTNLLEDFSVSNLAAKIPFLQHQQQYQSSTTSGGPVQYIQNLTPFGLGQFLSGLFASTPSATPGRPGLSTQYPVYPSNGDTSLMSALTSIAKYDDLKCVPRLLCEMAAGGRPGETQKVFGGRNTVLSLLSLIGGEMTSPVVVFGRAMLLGLTAQGDPGTCYSAYPSCPRDQNRLVDYLNNHRGGLFRFFSATGLPAYYPQQYSQARIQTSYKRLPMPQTSLKPPRVSINTDKGHSHILPQRKVLTHKKLPSLSSRPSSEFQKPLTFPGDRTRLYSVPQDEVVKDTPRGEKQFAFPDSGRTENSRGEGSVEAYPSPIDPSVHRLPPPVAVQLPDRTGTGELRIDNDENTFSPSPYPSRYKREVRSQNGINHVVFPLNNEGGSQAGRKMRFPSYTPEFINHSSGSQKMRDVNRKLNKQNSLNEHPVWNKPSDSPPREFINFPKSIDDSENRHEPKRHLMKFPLDNHSVDAAKISFNTETSAHKKNFHRMKFPIEYSDQRVKSESYHITKVNFHNLQEEAPYRFMFQQTGSKDDYNVAKISFNLETSKNEKSTRRMKFPVEHPDYSGQLESNHMKTVDHNGASKVKFQNIQDDFRETSSYRSILPHTGAKDTSNVVKFLESQPTR